MALYLYHATHLEDVLNNYDQSLLKGILANHYLKELLVLVLIMMIHF
jgi:hypothetical protein